MQRFVQGSVGNVCEVMYAMPFMQVLGSLHCSSSHTRKLAESVSYWISS